MNTKISLCFERFTHAVLIAVILSVLVFGSTNSQVQGQIDGGDPLSSQNGTGTETVIMGGSPVPGGPGFIMVSPFDFKPLHPTFLWDYNGISLYNPDTNFSVYVSGLSLPQGATITKMTLYFKDNSINDMYLYLFRRGMDNTEYQMAVLLTEGVADSFRSLSTTAISDPIVNNQSLSYHLIAYFPGNVAQNIMLTNVRIDYQYSTSLPCVMN